MEKLVKMLTLSLLVSLALSLASCPTKDKKSPPPKERAKLQEKPVRFEDPKIETILLVKLGKKQGPIMNTELANLKKLDLSGKDILNLSGLENCAKLTRLDLGANYLKNISPLASLNNLVVLNLEGNYIKSLEPLSGLTKLEELNLRSNRIKDISPLQNLHNLRILNLAGNQIKDLDPLAPLHELHRLDLTGNNVNDLSALVQNCKGGGISENDKVVLTKNPMGPNVRLRQIPALQECGAMVVY